MASARYSERRLLQLYELAFVRGLVEVLRLLARAFVERKLVVALDDDPPVVGLAGRGLSAEDKGGVVVGIEFVETGLQELGRDPSFDDLDIVLRMDFIDLDGGPAFLECELGKGKVGRDHPDAAVVVEPEINARRKKYLGLTLLGGEYLAGVERDGPDGFLSDGLSGEKSGALDVVDGPWAGWVCAESRRAQSRQ